MSNGAEGGMDNSYTKLESGLKLDSISNQGEESLALVNQGLRSKDFLADYSDIIKKANDNVLELEKDAKAAKDFHLWSSNKAKELMMVVHTNVELLNETFPPDETGLEGFLRGAPLHFKQDVNITLSMFNGLNKTLKLPFSYCFHTLLYGRNYEAPGSDKLKKVRLKLSDYMYLITILDQTSRILTTLLTLSGMIKMILKESKVVSDEDHIIHGLESMLSVLLVFTLGADLSARRYITCFQNASEVRSIVACSLRHLRDLLLVKWVEFVAEQNYSQRGVLYNQCELDESDARTPMKLLDLLAAQLMKAEDLDLYARELKGLVERTRTDLDLAYQGYTVSVPIVGGSESEVRELISNHVKSTQSGQISSLSGHYLHAPRLRDLEIMKLGISSKFLFGTDSSDLKGIPQVDDDRATRYWKQCVEFADQRKVLDRPFRNACRKSYLEVTTNHRYPVALSVSNCRDLMDYITDHCDSILAGTSTPWKVNAKALFGKVRKIRKDYWNNCKAVEKEGKTRMAAIDCSATDEKGEPLATKEALEQEVAKDIQTQEKAAIQEVMKQIRNLVVANFSALKEVSLTDFKARKRDMLRCETCGSKPSDTASGGEQFFCEPGHKAREFSQFYIRREQAKESTISTLSDLDADVSLLMEDMGRDRGGPAVTSSPMNTLEKQTQFTRDLVAAYNASNIIHMGGTKLRPPPEQTTVLPSSPTIIETEEVVKEKEEENEVRDTSMNDSLDTNARADEQAAKKKSAGNTGVLEQFMKQVKEAGDTREEEAKKAPPGILKKGGVKFPNTLFASLDGGDGEMDDETRRLVNRLTEDLSTKMGITIKKYSDRVEEVKSELAKMEASKETFKDESIARATRGEAIRRNQERTESRRARSRERHEHRSGSRQGSRAGSGSGTRQPGGPLAGNKSAVFKQNFIAQDFQGLSDDLSRHTGRGQPVYGVGDLYETAATRVSATGRQPRLNRPNAHYLDTSHTNQWNDGIMFGIHNEESWFDANEDGHGPFALLRGRRSRSASRSTSRGPSNSRRRMFEATEAGLPGGNDTILRAMSRGPSISQRGMFGAAGAGPPGGDDPGKDDKDKRGRKKATNQGGSGGFGGGRAGGIGGAGGGRHPGGGPDDPDPDDSSDEEDEDSEDDTDDSVSDDNEDQKNINTHRVNEIHAAARSRQGVMAIDGVTEDVRKTLNKVTNYQTECELLEASIDRYLKKKNLYDTKGPLDDNPIVQDLSSRAMATIKRLQKDVVDLLESGRKLRLSPECANGHVQSMIKSQIEPHKRSLEVSGDRLATIIVVNSKFEKSEQTRRDHATKEVLASSGQIQLKPWRPEEEHYVPEGVGSLTGGVKQAAAGSRDSGGK